MADLNQITVIIILKVNYQIFQLKGNHFQTD